MSSFNKELFADLLDKAKGRRSINQFSEASNISAAHISRLLRKMLDAPPSPQTISKFVKNASDNVTYDELMIAAGHIPNENDEIFKDIVKGDLKNTKPFIQVITGDLCQKYDEWYFEKNKDSQYAPDMTVKFKDPSAQTWCFKFVSQNTASDILCLYGIIALTELSKDIKYTIVVDSDEAFERFKSNAPKTLKANIYIMLVDLKQHQIVKEEPLHLEV